MSAHQSYFEVINHKIINPLPRSIHKAYMYTEFNMTKPENGQNHTNIEANKNSPKMICLNALGTFWNEYGNIVM